MQTNPVSWRMATCTLPHNSMYLHILPEARGSTLQRCQRCDIPLGAQRCPNPECHESHGQRAGSLCVWCRDNQQEHLETDDMAS